VKNLNKLKELFRKDSEWGKNPPRFPDWRAAVMVILGAFVLGLLLYRAPLLGWDWFFTFRQGGDIAFWYPGWTKLLVSPLAWLPWRWGLAFSNGLMLAAVSVATLHESRSRWGYLAALMAVLSPPVVILLWAGNVDGWMLLGYLLLPWGVPLLLIKPTIGAFALLTRRRWFIAGVIFAVLSVLIWGWWPAQAVGIHVLGDFKHTSSSMGWYVVGWPIGVLGILLLLFTNRKDPIQMMAAGSFVMPYVFPYHFILLLPAFGRVQYVRQLILWLISWTLIVSFDLGTDWAWVGYFFPLAVWWMLRSGNNEDTWLAELRRTWRKVVGRRAVSAP
jgi:hypothetical protein